MPRTQRVPGIWPKAPSEAVYGVEPAYAALRVALKSSVATRPM